VCSPEMDANQRAQYKPSEYGYFPATYLDNPIYANDPHYIAQLDSYQGPISQALKFGIWGVAGGYFDGAWDEAYNVYPARSVRLERYWKRWLGGDWGFDHNSVIHWFCMDDLGIERIYNELVVNKHTPEMVGRKFPSRIQTSGSPSQVSRIARSLASIPPNAIPIPSEAKVWATQPRAANVAPRCVIRKLTFVPVFPIPSRSPQQLLRGDGGVRDGVRSACLMELQP